MFSISEPKKQQGIYCCAYGCKNNPCSKKQGLCHKHYKRLRAQADPVYTRYANFKNNALRRGKEFTITLGQFREFCNETGYIITKGRRGRACSIDRIDNRQGYHIWNIQLLSMADNLQKYHEVDKLLTEENNEDLPF